jgi:hypothetical protein
MQPRSGMERRRATDREPAKQMGGQPNPGEEIDDDSAEQMRSPLTAQEFEHPRRRAEDKAAPAGERHASASSKGSKGEPIISGDEPPRGERGLPQSRTHRLEDE